MKDFLTTTLVVLISIAAYAQNDTIWYDDNWITTEKLKASFYRPAPEKIKEGYLFVDYYKNGNVQMKGLSLSEDEEVYHGTILWYFDNGMTFQIVNYQQGKLHGKRTVYYKSGSVRNTRIYDQGKLHGDWEVYYVSGVLKEKGFYASGEKHGIWSFYEEEGNLVKRGEFDSGEKIGTWEEFHPEIEEVEN
ncbi:MAG: toxin-antitoxin system YwqK family antitoxin [Flavobacteriaceae bacterium]